jgi:hypothetical protein
MTVRVDYSRHGQARQEDECGGAGKDCRSTEGAMGEHKTEVIVNRCHSCLRTISCRAVAMLTGHGEIGTYFALNIQP